MSASLENRRLRSLTLIFILFFTIIFLRLIYIQVFEAGGLRARAEKQRVKDIELLAKRGTIYDREGKELAVSVKKQTIFATPYLIEKPVNTATRISKILGLKRSEVYKKLISGKGFIYLARKADQSKADKIKALNIEGIGFIDEYKREYLFGVLASQVLGCVGIDNNGLSGIENEKDKVLRGKLGRLVFQQDALGREIPGSTSFYRKPYSGKDVRLTIDTDIQFKTEEELRKIVKLWGAKSGQAIVVDTKTGEIYAMASMPDFNPNKLAKTTAEQMKNRPVVEIFEPGSTMKPMLASAAIEERIFSPESMFNLPPSINVGGKMIGEAHDRATVNYSLSDIIVNSSNVGMSKIGLRMGKNLISEYLHRYGFEEKTNIEYPGEITGRIPSLDNFFGSTIATTCFGQGVSTTGIGLVRAYSALANGGIMNDPYLVKREKTSSIKGKRIVSKKTAWEMTRILEKVVESGTGTTAKVPGYLIAGKTGTAQKSEGKKGYSGGKFISSFIGYGPAEDASLIVLVSLDEPTKAIYGGVVAAPAFSAIMEYSLSHLQISPR